MTGVQTCALPISQKGFCGLCHPCHLGVRRGKRNDRLGGVGDPALRKNVGGIGLQQATPDCDAAWLDLSASHRQSLAMVFHGGGPAECPYVARGGSFFHLPVETRQKRRSVIIFAAKNLICGYGRKVVLENVSLKVEEGDVLCILGPNGVGKTTRRQIGRASCRERV